MHAPELVRSIARDVSELVRKEVALARAELQQNFRKETAAAKGLGVAGVCGLTALSLLLVAVALVIGIWLPAWAGALIVAGAVLLVGSAAGLSGWRKRVRVPLEGTRRTVKEDVTWAKRRLT
jgi:hypothetical protein